MTDNTHIIDLSNEALIFYHVALLHGFRATASHLGLSKSVVSAKVASLESRIGKRLLFRSTRDISLTPEGELYFETCKNLFTCVQNLKSREAEFKTGLNGVLTISAPHDLMIWLAPTLLKMQGMHPKLRFNLISADQVINLEKSKIDLAVRVGADGSNHLFRSPFFQVKFGFYCRPSLLPEKKSDRQLLEWIQTEGVFVFRPSREKSFQLHGETQDVKVQNKVQVNDVLSLKSLVMAGAGVGILPHFVIAEEVKAGELVEILPSAQIKGVSFIFLSGVKRQDDARLDAVIGYLQKAMNA